MVDHTQTAAPSLILALHARFEANNAEYEAIEMAKPSDDLAEQGRIDRALVASAAEETTLRHAILSQVPDANAEALVLLFHIRIEQDAQANSSGPVPEPASENLRMAIDTLFDFHACETKIGDFDAGELGIRLRSACQDVYKARRYRTGVMGG